MTKSKRSMIKVDEFPAKQSFVAVWEVFYNGAPTLFSASLHYNEEEDQHYYYDGSLDIFLPECDHGVDKRFLERIGATYFVIGE